MLRLRQTKILRLRQTLLIIIISYRDLPLYRDSTLGEFLDDFRENASAIPAFDRRLRYLSTALQPCYADHEVSRPGTVPEGHWWWDL